VVTAALDNALAPIAAMEIDMRRITLSGGMRSPRLLLLLQSIDILIKLHLRETLKCSTD